MKKLLALLPLLFVLTSCQQTANLQTNIETAKKETTEAIENLTNEIISIKQGLENKIRQVKDAADAVSNAAEALNEAKDSLQTVMGGEVVVEDTAEETSE